MACACGNGPGDPHAVTPAGVRCSMLLCSPSILAKTSASTRFDSATSSWRAATACSIRVSLSRIAYKTSRYPRARPCAIVDDALLVGSGGVWTVSGNPKCCTRGLSPGAGVPSSVWRTRERNSADSGGVQRRPNPSAGNFTYLPPTTIRSHISRCCNRVSLPSGKAGSFEQLTVSQY